jgi:hypothetical protein
MLVTLDGIVIEVSEVVKANALFPILVTPSGIVIDVRAVALENA